ncbi:hypothetical protein IC582_004989 [Cucumis melo]
MKMKSSEISGCPNRVKTSPLYVFYRRRCLLCLLLLIWYSPWALSKRFSCYLLSDCDDPSYKPYLLLFFLLNLLNLESIHMIDISRYQLVNFLNG